MKKFLDGLYFIGLVVVIAVSAFAIETAQKIKALFKSKGERS